MLVKNNGIGDFLYTPHTINNPRLHASHGGSLAGTPKRQIPGWRALRRALSAVARRITSVPGGREIVKMQFALSDTLATTRASIHDVGLVCELLADTVSLSCLFLYFYSRYYVDFAILYTRLFRLGRCTFNNFSWKISFRCFVSFFKINSGK